MHTSNRFIFVAAAAVAATMGDLLMLHVVATARTVTGIVRPPGASLVVGAMLGVMGIPFYWFGYWLLARIVAPTRPMGGRLLMICGALIGSVGALIHAVTAFAIRLQMVSGDAPLPPAEWIGHSGTSLLACWIVVALAAVVAGIVLMSAALARDTPIPLSLGLLNPAVLTVILAAMGMDSSIGEAFLVPAAPNVAHVIFFFLAAARIDSSE